MASDRQTFLFADLAGFTALTEAHGDEQAAELAAAFSDCVGELLADHRAEQVKTIGDALMIRCPDAANGVELGLRIVEEVGAQKGFPLVRVGMHTGPAVERDGDWFGAVVNLAARVSGAAGGEEVLLTAATRDAAGEIEAVRLTDRGQHRFKNVREAVQIFGAVRERGAAQGQPIDPVCRMAVDPLHAAGTLTHDGREYHFCSLKCARAFASAPQDYTGY